MTSKIPDDTPWHDAVLNACMSTEACYISDDPVKTINDLIDWHIANDRMHSVPVQQVATKKLPTKRIEFCRHSESVSVQNLLQDCGCAFGQCAKGLIY